MLDSRRNNIVKHLHERCLWLIYDDKSPSYDELLLKDGSVSIQDRNIKILAIEIFKFKNDLSPEIAPDTFLQQAQTQYNFRHNYDFRTPEIE